MEHLEYGTGNNRYFERNTLSAEGYFFIVAGLLFDRQTPKTERLKKPIPCVT
jgi:hypothetical protein